MDDSLPLRKRPVDFFFTAYYILYLFTVTFTDLHNFTASVYRVSVPELEHMNLQYPPKVLSDIYFKWGRTIDPLLYENPMFWQVMEWMNLLVLTPFSAIAIIGFVRGWNSIRMPTVIMSAFTMYSLIICIGTTLWGPNPTPNPSAFLGIYLPYLIFPLLSIVRLWRERPFSSELSAATTAVLASVSSGMYIYFSYHVMNWLRLQMPHLLPGSLIGLLNILMPVSV